MSASPSPWRLPSMPLLAALGLVAVEFAAISFFYDVKPLGWRTDGWRVMGQLGPAATLAVAAAAGMVLIGFVAGGQGKERLRALLVARPLDGAVFGTLGLHACLYALLFWLSSRIFSPLGPPDGSPALWIAGWLVASLAVVASGAALGVPPEGRAPLVRALAPLVGGGALVGAGAWLSAQGSQLLWLPLSPFTLRAAAAVLSIFVTPAAEPDSAILGIDDFQVHVAPECAGFEGMGLMTAFVAATLVLARHELRFPAALLLLPIGIVAAWTLNLFRIVALVLIGRYVSADIAIGGFHAKAGWLLFCALALGLVALSRRVRFFSKQPSDFDLGSPTAAYLMPFLVMLALAFTTGLFTRNIDLLYGVRIAGSVLALLAFRAYYRDPAVAPAGTRADWAITVALGLAAFAVFVALAPRPAAADVAAWEAQWAGFSPAGQAAWLTLRVLGSVFVVPIAEELAFRGYLQRRLVAAEFETVPPARRAPVALVVASLAFGAVHGGIAAGALAGVCFGLAQWRGGSVAHPIVAHVVANAAVATFVLGFGQWWIWQ